MTFEDKKSYYVGRLRSEAADPVKALDVLNEFLADEELDIDQRAEISRELARVNNEDTN